MALATCAPVEDPVCHGGSAHSKNGWGWRYGLSWFSTDIDRSIGGSNTELGQLRVRPFMEDDHRVHADMFIMKIGAVYLIF